MKGAIASVEIYAHRGAESVRRLTLAVSEPASDPSGAGWKCRIALADLHRPRDIVGRDSIEVLERALACARQWLVGLQGEGFELFRDREGQEPYRLDDRRS